MMEQIEFPWEFDTWYTMKLAVEQQDERAIIRGKVWPKGEEEPDAWSITVEDALPIRQGAPGLSGYSPAPIHYDNISIASN